MSSTQQKDEALALMNSQMDDESKLERRAWSREEDDTILELVAKVSSDKGFCLLD